MSLFNELKRRNVFKVGIAYLVGSWLIIQVADILFESIGTPEWVLQTMFVVLGTGFFVALFFAWAFELTPEGIKRENEVDRSHSITTNTGRKLDFTIIGLLVVIAGYFIWESRFSDMESDSVSMQSQQLVVGSGEENRAPVPAEAVISRQSIAVLPFDNRSRLEEDEFFVEGMHDDLLTNLARIGSLKVISRTSVNQYKGTEKTIPVIAKELGVATVMEGAVQRAGNTVRINVQLIDAKTDEHLWAEIFDRELTTDNLFAIQSEISQAIADALEATLSPAEQEQINRKPTENLAAYNAYLLGRQLLPKRTSVAMEQAMEEFKRAVELDPEFALAWVGIAESAMLRRTYGSYPLDQTISNMENAINHALDIDPLLGEAYASQGQLHGMKDQLQEAERAYQLSIKLSPNYASAYHWLSLLLANQPERLRESLEWIKKAGELDPLSPVIRQSIAWVYEHLGEFELAEQLYLEVIELNPNFPNAVNSLAELYGGSMGRLDEALKWDIKSRSMDSGSMWFLANEQRHLSQVGATSLEEEAFGRMEDLDPDHTFVTITGAFNNLKKGKFDAAREYVNFLNTTTQAPWVQWMGGVVIAATEDYDNARELMLRSTPGFTDRIEWARLIGEWQNDACAMAWVFMRTGDESMGHDLATETLTYLEQALPKYLLHADRFNSAGCYAALGDLEGALKSLEVQVNHNHISNWSFVHFWPPLKIVHDDPRFIAMDQQVKEELQRQRVIVEAMYAEQAVGL